MIRLNWGGEGGFEAAPERILTMTERENLLRAVRFERPEWIPMKFHVVSACWNHYDQGRLQDLMEAHPSLFPGFERKEKVVPYHGPNRRKDAPYTGPWGCVWETADDGIEGVVRVHPLADWSALEGFSAPDPEFTDGTFPLDWDRIRAGVARRREAGELVGGALPHGHTFLRLQNLRGYENLVFDMADGDPRLRKLIRAVEDFNCRYVSKWLELGPDMMCYPEDLGMQTGPMISPECFREYIKPVYLRMIEPARDRGCVVHLHSDGNIRALADDLLECGIDIVNIQDLVNGIDWIAGKFSGSVCVEADIDRQDITPRGTPGQVDALVREEVEKLGSREGGLMMIYGLYPGVPYENIEALMDAMENYAGFYA